MPISFHWWKERASPSCLPKVSQVSILAPRADTLYLFSASHLLQIYHFPPPPMLNCCISSGLSPQYPPGKFPSVNQFSCPLFLLPLVNCYSPTMLYISHISKVILLNVFSSDINNINTFPKCLKSFHCAPVNDRIQKDKDQKTLWTRHTCLFLFIIHNCPLTIL